MARSFLVVVMNTWIADTPVVEKKNVTAIMEFFSVKDLKKFLDPAYMDESTLSDEAKMEIILAGKV